MSIEAGIGFTGNFVRLEPLTVTFPAPPSPLEAELLELRDRVKQLEAAVVALATGGTIGITAEGVIVR